MSQPPPLPKLRVLHLLATAGIYFCSGGFLMQFPRYVLRAGGTAQDAGWLLALGLIPTLLFSAPVGEWNRKYGGRWPAVIGCLLAALSSVSMLALEQVGAGMIVLRLLYATGHAMIFGTLFAQAAFMLEHPLQRAKLIGWTAVTIQLGNAAGGVLGEAAYHAGPGWFWLGSAGIALVAAVLGAAWTHTPHTSEPAAPETASEKPAWPGEVWATVAVGMAFAGMIQFLPTFIDHLGRSGEIVPFAASWFITPALLMVALVRLVGGYFASRLLRPWVLALCHLVLLLTMLLVPWMHSIAQAVALGAAFGLSYGWLYPALSALAFERVAPKYRGRVSGWLVSAFEIGFRLGPIGFGALITYAGYRAMFAGVALSYVTTLALAWCMGRKSLRLAPLGA